MQAEIINLNDDIKAKNDQIAELGKQILDFVMASHDALDKSDIVQVDYPFSQWPWASLFWHSQVRFLSYLQAVSEMRAQLNEKSFELEVLKLSLSVYTVLIETEPKMALLYNLHDTFFSFCL